MQTTSAFCSFLLLTLVSYRDLLVVRDCLSPIKQQTFRDINVLVNSKNFLKYLILIGVREFIYDSYLIFEIHIGEPVRCGGSRRCAIRCRNWRCVSQRHNTPSQGFGAVLSAITQCQSAEVGKPAYTAGSPTSI